MVVLRHMFSNNNDKDLLKIYLGDGKVVELDYKSQHNFNVYDQFKVDLYQKNNCEIEFKEKFALYFDEQDLYVKTKFDDEFQILNTKLDYFVSIFDDITSRLSK